jgi:hypothetical protein
MKALFIVFSLLISFTGFTQAFGELRGKVIDQETGEPLPFVKVTLEQTAETQLYWAQTDFDGNFKISNVVSDTFDLRVRFIGYTTQVIKDIYIVPDGITTQDVEMPNSEETLDCVVVQSKEIQRVDIQNMPTRSTVGISSTYGGVTGGVISIRGSNLIRKLKAINSRK